MIHVLSVWIDVELSVAVITLLHLIMIIYFLFVFLLIRDCYSFYLLFVRKTNSQTFIFLIDTD